MDIIIIDTVYKNLEIPVEKVNDKRYGEITSINAISVEPNIVIKENYRSI
jgi:hypothetical protein